MDKGSWIPPNVPLDRPSAARIYDYLLGGYHNFESDRTIAENLSAIYPDIRLAAQVNRAFLRRAVYFLADQGIGQFLDIGSGIPTVGNVHEVAQALNPGARVAYVDIDPVAVAHSKSMLQGNTNAVAVQGDVREPEVILGLPEVRNLIDFARPVGLLLIAVLHYVLDDTVADQAVRTLRDALAPGSYLVIAHATRATRSVGLRSQMNETFRRASDTKSRMPEQVERFFHGFTMVEPGLVYTPLWRPEGTNDALLHDPARAMVLAGVGRKPEAAEERAAFPSTQQLD